MRLLFIALFSVISLVSNSQSVDDVINQAQSSGISSQEDILRELERRGMTIQDAQRMALIYGIDYEEYISQYITELMTKYQLMRKPIQPLKNAN